ncbi:multiple epidermal growth factor-like domains protein 10 isoform X2 [Littorina saxatilis]|uniref:multiple epidermal growth factor-like domains protein 10 isoform X2 n=1 Tax=Littorina saxatilis TaxID=31220 RepID=UPI0038B52BB6
MPHMMQPALCLVSEPEERFLCSICHNLMVKPVETPCGHVFCHDCLHYWLSQSLTCPSDRTEVTENSVHPVHSLEREIGNLLASCPNAAAGCRETPTVLRYQEHTQTCRGPYPMPARGTNSRTTSHRSLYPVLTEEEDNRRNHQTSGGTDFPGYRVRCPITSFSLRVTIHSQLCRNWQRQCLTALLVVFIAACILVPLLVMHYQEKPHAQSALNGRCSTRGATCADPSGSLHLSCDLAKLTCLLQTGANCSGQYHDSCVSGAFCNQTSKSCVCAAGFHAVHNICVLELGEECSAWNNNMCYMDEYCDLHGTKQCRCLKEYHPSGYICRLKAGVASVDCSQVMDMTSCVEHASCDTKTEQCLCDKDFSVKEEGTCGLQVSVRLQNTTCADFPLCVDNATCTDAQHSCVCDDKFAPLPNRTCGLKAKVPDVDCRQVTACVEDASCDTTSQQCLCDEKFSVRNDGTCGLQVSWKLEDKTCAEFPTCVDNATCSDAQHSCICDQNFAPLSNHTCGLKAEVPNVDCSQVTACVDHATCESNRGQCLCDENFSIKSEHTCGLQASVKRPDTACVDFPPCVDYAQCSDTQHSCLCEQDFAQLFNRTCGLKTDVPSKDCRIITSCVLYATCMTVSAGHECKCNPSISVMKSDTTCGLVPNIPTPNCATTICADTTSCAYDSHSEKDMCKCADGKSWDKAANVCDGCSVTVPSLVITMATSLTSCLLLGWL